MRIVHLDTGREMRGGQWQVLRLLEGAGGTLLARAGAPLLAEALRRGIDARPLGFSALLRVSKDAELVHAHDARAHTLGALAGVKLVVARRVAFPIGSSAASKWKYRAAAHYIAVSNHVKRLLMDAEVPESKVAVVGDGVPLAGFRPRTGGRILTNDPRKNLGLVGRAARLLGLTVHPAADLHQDLRDAGLLVYISEAEGLGSGVLLAMAAGVPVVASRVGGLPEIVIDGETGVLTGNRPEDIAAAMRRMLDDPVLAEACSRRARRMVEERFSVDAMVRATAQVYERVLG